MAKARNILIVKLAAIGDIVLSTPTFRAIRRACPDARISLLIGEASASLIDQDPSFDERWIVEESIFWNKKVYSLWKLFVDIRKRRFGCVYILHWSRWFHLFFWLCGIPERIGFARDGQSFRLTRKAPYREADPDKHDVDQNLRLVCDHPELLLLADRKPELFFTNDERQNVRHLLNSYKLPSDRPWIAIAPGGGRNVKHSMPQKRWPIKHYLRLVDELCARHQAFVILLGDQHDHFLSSKLMGPQRVNLAGEITLRQTALVIEICLLYIGNDSGLLHVAGAMGTPSLSFFGPTSPYGKTPFWMNHKALYTSESCSPCYKNGVAPLCPYLLKCLNNISPEMAYTAVHELLSDGAN